MPYRCSCGQTTAGASLCSKCRRTAMVALGNIASYFDDLEIVRTGRSRFGSGAAGKTTRDGYIGMDTRFDREGSGTAVQDETRNFATTWCRALLDDRPGTPLPSHDSVRAFCRWLAENMPAISTLAWGPDFLAEAVAVEAGLRRLIDRPADTWYAGACGATTLNWVKRMGDETADIVESKCQRVLYADPARPMVRCPDCKSEFPLADRRAMLLAEAEDREATVRTLARIVTTLVDPNASEAKLEGKINVWVQRGHLKSNGKRVVDGRARPVYRVGAVLDLISNAERRQLDASKRVVHS